MTLRTGRVVARAATLLLILAGSICGGTVQGCRSVVSAPRDLANAQPSPEALSRAYLDALARKDTDAMKALRITRDEFCRYVFPELPAAKTPNVSCDWVWDQATLKSMAGMARVLNENGSARYEYVSITYASTERYDSFNVLKSPTVTVRDEQGRQSDVRLFGSILEMDGKYKLFSFVVD